MVYTLTTALPSCGADLRRISLFRDTPERDLDRIITHLTSRNIRKGGALIIDRNVTNRVCFVWSGLFRLTVASPPKRPVTLAIMRPSETFGHATAIMGATWGPKLRVICDESGTLLEMGAERYAAFRREVPALSEATLAMLSTLAADHASRIFELAALSARERVQAELLRLARHGEWHGRRCVLHPAPTHEVLAAQVGAAREVVTRALRDLAADGLIRMQRGVIECLDIEQLLALDQAATGRVMYDPKSFLARR